MSKRKPYRVFECRYSFCGETATTWSAIVPKCPMHGLPMRRVKSR